VAEAIEQVAAGERMPADPLLAVERLLTGDAPPASPGTEPASRDEVVAHLRRLNIGEPKRGELLALPHVTQPGYLERWVGWFEGQNEFGPGWVIVQLEAGEPPPAASEGQVPAGEDPVAAAVVQLYQAEIGPITPAVGDSILDATAPEGENLRDEALWRRAFRQAAVNNVRKWTYVLAVARKLHSGERGDEKHNDADGREPYTDEDLEASWAPYVTDGE
jgi:hypothetical protein